MWYVINVGTDRPYGKYYWLHTKYESERTAKAQCTRLNKEYSAFEVHKDSVAPQWKVMSIEDYAAAHPVKMVEKINLMSGLPYMEAEDTPGFCSPSSESYWSR